MKPEMKQLFQKYIDDGVLDNVSQNVLGFVTVEWNGNDKIILTNEESQIAFLRGIGACSRYIQKQLLKKGYII